MYQKFLRLNPIVQLIVFLSISLLIGELLDILSQFFSGDENISKLNFEGYSLYEIILEVVVIAPLLESFLIQFLLVELLLLLFSKSNYKYIIVILFSGAIFGLLHQYNFYYMVATSLMGWIFGAIYIFYKVKKSINPFIAILSVHTFHNLITLVIDYDL